MLRFRNMVCHTTYETLRGETVYPQPNNQFYNRHGTPGADSTLNRCAPSNYATPPVIRRPLLKDINYYLNKAENQLMRQQEQPSSTHRSAPSSHPSHHSNYHSNASRHHRPPPEPINERRKTYHDLSSNGNSN